MTPQAAGYWISLLPSTTSCIQHTIGNPLSVGCCSTVGDPSLDSGESESEGEKQASKQVDIHPPTLLLLLLLPPAAPTHPLLLAEALWMSSTKREGERVREYSLPIPLPLALPLY